ncbi:hypothetical protein VTK56DRAFT_2389 [Thermocarpiscus australiensis]
MSRLLRSLRTPLTGHLARSPLPASISPARQASTFLQNQPAPPRLPADQQAEFERLQRAAEAALSSHTTTTVSTPTPPPLTATATAAEPSPPLTTSRHVSTPSSNPAQVLQHQTQTQRTQGTQQDLGVGVGVAAGAGTFSGGIRQGAPPEFEGDKNPKTGEIGGPKNEPLRWGSEGDWSYNGRVTDF